jgi:hypothetical protein
MRKPIVRNPKSNSGGSPSMVSFNEKDTKIVLRLEIVYQLWRKKGLFPYYSPDFDIAWRQMRFDEQLALYEAAIKKRKQRRKKNKTGKKGYVPRKLNRKAGRRKSRRFGSVSDKVDSVEPQADTDRNILIEKPVIVVGIKRDMPEISNQMTGRISSTRIVGLLK